jgi:hypothetical protein
VYNSRMSGTLHTGLHGKQHHIRFLCNVPTWMPPHANRSKPQREATHSTQRLPRHYLIDFACRSRTPYETRLMNRFEAVIHQHLSTGVEHGAILFTPTNIT